MIHSFEDNKILGRYSGEPASPDQRRIEQLLAASLAVVKLERIASSGVLSEDEERDTREIVCKVCRAFGIPSIAERPLSNVIDMQDTAEELVRREMARVL